MIPNLTKPYHTFSEYDLVNNKWPFGQCKFPYNMSGTSLSLFLKTELFYCCQSTNLSSKQDLVLFTDTRDTLLTDNSNQMPEGKPTEI